MSYILPIASDDYFNKYLPSEQIYLQQLEYMRKFEEEIMTMMKETSSNTKEATKKLTKIFNKYITDDANIPNVFVDRKEKYLYLMQCILVSLSHGISSAYDTIGTKINDLKNVE